jgi:hypothetical protein
MILISHATTFLPAQLTCVRCSTAFGRNGFLAAYNAGPGRYEQYLLTGRPLPRETIDYVRKAAPLINAAVPIPMRSRQG